MWALNRDREYNAKFVTFN